MRPGAREPSPSPLPALALAAALSACASTPPPRCAFPAGDPSPASAAAPPYRYQVEAGPGAEELCVEVALPPGSRHLRSGRALEPFIRDLAVDEGRGFTPAALGERGWPLGACAQGCRARYRFLLGEAARSLDDSDSARAHRGAFIAPPSSFLLRPEEASPDGRYRLSVTTSPGVSFVTGVFHEEPEGDAVVGRLGDLIDAPYTAFGPLTRTRARLPGGTLDIALLGGEPKMGRARLEQWVEAQARAVAAYYGRFPIEHAAVLITLEGGDEIGNGRTMGNGGASVILRVGKRIAPERLPEDWVLVHELCHVSFPNVLRPWAEEGLATYLEPIIRVRAGTLTRDELWRALLEGLPQGQPDDGDQGLDHTDTWGRRYWGGAMFWLLADVEIRKRSGGARGLGDALRGIAAEGGNVAVTWTLDRALAVGDAAVGGQALRDLRRRLGEAPVTIDLDALWDELGVHLRGDRVVYDEGAPLAAIRRGITEVAPR
jgi:predicted metalloprotease with PDZ domain